MSVNKNNSIDINEELKITYKEGKHAITSMASDHMTGTIMIGTHT